MKPYIIVTWQDGEQARSSVRNLDKGRESAQANVIYNSGHPFAALYTRTGKLVARYWWDGQLQYIDY